MKIEVLGCSGGKINSSNLPAFLVDEKILLDCGTVCSVLSLERQTNIEGVFISHSHFDHINDLPFLIDNLSIAGKTLKIFASGDTNQVLKEHIFNDRIWPDFTKIPDEKKPVLSFNNVFEERTITFHGYRITPFSVFHIQGSLGFVFEKNGSVFAYTSDMSRTDGLWEKLINLGVKTVITECSFPEGKDWLARVSSHLSVKELRAEIERMERFENVYIFHAKPHFRNLIEKEVSGLNVYVLNDGDILEV